ncbi:MAG: SpoIVB peptidase S55 domain-containing protein [Synoicihabitans sp.]
MIFNIPNFLSRCGRWLGRLWIAGFVAIAAPGQPKDAPILVLENLEAGMVGEVWTVFQGQVPESFEVKITGVIQNALGPGKSMILCELTDPRVQHMGAVAGMSGSPLYIEGKFAGALSYQVQRFETVRFAGFTPAEDLLEVRRIALDSSRSPDTTTLPTHAAHRVEGGTAPAGLMPLTPVFSFGGLSPQVAELMAKPLAELGIATTTLGGASTESGDSSSPTPLTPGGAVGAALAVGDITLAGTGTVSQVDGNRVLAFGHPLLGLGEVEMPMMTAEIVTILPSNMSSMKISNTGSVIGTVRQDRLSAIYGEIGAGPDMIPVTVHTPHRTLNFSTVRHQRITPMITVLGLSQAILGSNDSGLAEGFAVTTRVLFEDGEELEMSQLYAGAKSFRDGMNGLTADLATWLQNPVEEAFPAEVVFSVEPLATNPTTSMDNVRLSHRSVRPRERFEVNISLRDFQSQSLKQTVEIPVPAEWAGESMEVIVANGPTLDLLAGGQRTYPVSQIRDFASYLDVLRNQRRPDGLYVAVVRQAQLFFNETDSTVDLPDSFSRIARKADEARFSTRKAREILWESHILPDRLVPGMVRRPLSVTP